ncbi:unnamed protein product [Symbiodinium natans]|uniref:Uncharacterized protein n=1 Tax=Symbiodinium natans TaxID=878477 RepID=A0A812RK25_9DINO|nr:unnamed protein product [Symbiodinium natans]
MCSPGFLAPWKDLPRTQAEAHVPVALGTAGWFVGEITAKADDYSPFPGSYSAFDEENQWVATSFAGWLFFALFGFQVASRFGDGFGDESK